MYLLLYSGRVRVELVLIFLIYGVGFANEAIWATSFICGKAVNENLIFLTDIGLFRLFCLESVSVV